MAENYPMDSVLIFRGEFRTPKTADPPNALTDPNVVTLRLQRPDKTVVALTYPADPIIRDSIGKYNYKLLLAQEGTYHWRWTGTNGADAAGVSAGAFNSRREPNF